MERCFDPYTRDRAAGQRRLLYMDGPAIHTQVDFLEACWARDIDVIILPANLSARFQPLDVNFFHNLKNQYSMRVDDYQLGTTDLSAPKGLFYHWLQEAWADTAVTLQIESAWRRSGLSPLDKAIMGVPETTPEPTLGVVVPETPENERTLRRIKSQVRTGEVSHKMAFEKTAKALERMMAEETLAQKELKRNRDLQALAEAARNGNKRTRYTGGRFFDPTYQQENATELERRKEAELKSREEARRKSQSKGKQPVRALDLQPVEGPSTAVRKE